MDVRRGGERDRAGVEPRGLGVESKPRLQLARDKGGSFGRDESCRQVIRWPDDLKFIRELCVLTWKARRRSQEAKARVRKALDSGPNPLASSHPFSPRWSQETATRRVFSTIIGRLSLPFDAQPATADTSE